MLNQGVVMLFYDGDQVRLKNGEGPCMTVKKKSSDGNITCFWQAENGEYQEGEFPFEALDYCNPEDKVARKIQDVFDLNK